MSANAEALRRAVIPGCTVIDIGAGTGIFSLLACQFGAESVIAIEPNDAIQLLASAAAANGVRDRITVIQGLSSEYAPDALADVIISDLRGHLPLFEQHIPTIIDARHRLLAPGGTLIPMRDTLHMALAHHPETYASYTRPWLDNDYGLDLSDAHQRVINQWRKVAFAASDLRSVPEHLATIDYMTIDHPDLSAEASIIADQSGVVHGFVVWFDVELASGVGFSNAPGEPKLVYGQTFFPFEQPIDLATGDRIDIALQANLIGDSYIWSWITTATLADGQQISFRQSTFAAKILTPTMLHQVSPGFVPLASATQLIDRHCLSLIDGQATLSKIADQLTTKFPQHFKDGADALSYAADVAGRYRAEKLRSPAN